MFGVDCRLDSIEGYVAHKDWCDRILAQHAGNVGVVLPAEESGFYYCQYSYRYETGNPGCLKMLQTVGYLHHAWEVMADTHGLSTIYALDRKVLAAITPAANRNLARLRLVNLDMKLPPELAPARQLNRIIVVAPDGEGVINWSNDQP